MTNDEILAAVRKQLSLCAGWGGDIATTDRAKALDAYFMRARGDERVGRSRVVSGDISAAVDATHAQVMDAFSSDDICEFTARGPEDEAQAKLESDVVAHFVMKAQRGRLEIGKAIKNALLLRLGVVKVWVETRTTVDRRTLEN